jgi:hypothetical protein
MGTQQDLYKMLAEGGTRLRDTRRIHQQAIANIATLQQQTLSELSRLRDRIESAGIGNDPEAEAQYLKLLATKRKLEQVHQMNPVLAAMPPVALQKALDYGLLLLQVYSGGQLSKAAGGDIEAHILRLKRYRHPAAIAQINALEQLL